MPRLSLLAQQHARSNSLQNLTDTPLGPFHLSTNKLLVGYRSGSLYAGKLVEKSKDERVLLAGRQYALDGSFVGELSDPFPVRADPTGNLSMKSLEAYTNRCCEQLNQLLR
jgi:hypothetical protein